MIVIDTNLIAYLLLPGRQTEKAERVSVRGGRLSIDQAIQCMEKATALVAPREFKVRSEQVLGSAAGSRWSVRGLPERVRGVRRASGSLRPQ